MNRCRFKSCRAFTMVEAMFAIAILGILLVVALNTVGASNANQFRAAQRATADALAQDMLNDIVQLAYQEPNGTPAFGIESNESSTSKANYDDVDDFNNWYELPPQDRNGNPMQDLQGWSRVVIVQWVTAATPGVAASTETGLKMITVCALKNGVVIAQRSALKGKYP